VLYVYNKARWSTVAIEGCLYLLICLEMFDMSVNYSANGTSVFEIFPRMQCRRWLWPIQFIAEGNVELNVGIPGPTQVPKGISRMKLRFDHLGKTKEWFCCASLFALEKPFSFDIYCSGTRA
jgi:hypothetical protein